MVAYFVRRLVGGAITLILAWLVIHSVLVYGPGGRPLESIWNPYTREVWKNYLERHFGLDQPWPISSLTYLFDPTECCIGNFDSPDKSGAGLTKQRGISLSVNGVTFAGRGALTGDFGVSMFVERRTPVTDLFGPGLGELLLAVTAAIFLLMAVAVAQRLRRPSPYAFSSHPTTPDRPRPFWLT
jgi:ABC-type dipeptide/oligopeptide/nickel transport system permease component